MHVCFQCDKMCNQVVNNSEHGMFFDDDRNAIHECSIYVVVESKNILLLSEENSVRSN